MDKTYQVTFIVSLYQLIIISKVKVVFIFHLLIKINYFKSFDRKEWKADCVEKKILEKNYTHVLKWHIFVRALQVQCCCWFHFKSECERVLSASLIQLSLSSLLCDCEWLTGYYMNTWFEQGFLMQSFT